MQKAGFCVSLFTREWIEIIALTFSTQYSNGLPLYEGVDWNLALLACPALLARGLPLYEGVDWNSTESVNRIGRNVSLFTREWIEITVSKRRGNMGLSLPLYEGVDWNFHQIRQESQRRICLPLYEGVDWNHPYHCTLKSTLRLPLYEGVDWNRQRT